MISQETARQIWNAYSEIDNGTKLLAEMEERKKQYKDPNPRDAFGERKCLQLGVPCGESGHRLYNVRPELAMACIGAHIAEKNNLLTALMERAKLELEGGAA